MGTQKTVTKLTFEIWKAGMQAVLDCSNRRERRSCKSRNCFHLSTGSVEGLLDAWLFSHAQTLETVTTSSLAIKDSHRIYICETVGGYVCLCFSIPWPLLLLGISALYFTTFSSTVSLVLLSLYLIYFIE